MDPKTQLQLAYVLHTRSYQESSLLVELLTAQGRISVIAKGAKRAKSMYRGILQPFIPLRVTYTGRNELKTLTYAEVSQQQLLLQGDYLLAGFYVNELLMRLLLKESPCNFLFQCYEHILFALRSEQDLWICLRLFEKNLLKALGYELNLTVDINSGEDIDPNRYYLYFLDQGPTQLDEQIVSADYIFKGKTLLDLAQGNLQDDTSRKQAKQLLRQALAVHLGPRPLQSQALMR